MALRDGEVISPTKMDTAPDKPKETIVTRVDVYIYPLRWESTKLTSPVLAVQSALKDGLQSDLWRAEVEKVVVTTYPEGRADLTDTTTFYAYEREEVAISSRWVFVEGGPKS